MMLRKIINTTNSQVLFCGAKSKSLNVTAADQKILRVRQVVTIVARLSNLPCNLAAKTNPAAYPKRLLMIKKPI